MKIGFWTLGMPPWSAIELAGKAAELGYHGVDLRCTPLDNGRPSNGGQLSTESRDDEVEVTKSAFAEAGVEIASLLCSNPARPGSYSENLAAYESDVNAHAKLASRIGSSTIRVATPPDSEGDLNLHLTKLWQRVQRALDDSEAVRAVFQNHPPVTAQQLLVTAREFGDPRIGVELSPDHCMTMQEDTLELLQQHGSWVFQVCYADRRVVQDKLADFDGRYYHVRYEAVMPGEGGVPAAKIFSLLKNNGFDGYVSLKWEKGERYGHHLPDGEIALASFPNFMRRFNVVDS